MLVFLKDDINSEEIAKRFEEISHRGHKVELSCKNLDFSEYSKIHPNDLGVIAAKVAEDYKTSEADFIYVSGMHVDDGAFRSAICSSSEYKLKK